MLSWELSPDLATHRRDRAWVEINLNALEHNVRQIRRKLSPHTALLAVVKADAYGHGAVTIARSALQQGASWLGVATIPEGIELRKAGIKAPILLLGATNTPEEVEAVSQWRIEPTLCTPKQAWVFKETIASEGRNRLPVHLMIDTGMSRLGVPWQQTAELGQLVSGIPQLQIASVYSHLATADSPDPTIMQLQHQRYQTAIAQLKSIGVHPPRLHFANSAATLVDSALHYDMVRVGLAMYGLYPAPHLQGTIDLQPVMQVKARVTQVKEIAAGTGVSYGYQYVADRDIRLAVVGIGYADGVPRNLSNRIEVLIRGQRVPQIGAITMDQLMLDVSRIPNLREGEVVTLLGQDGNDRITADDWANKLGTISWEILCSFKHRLPRIAIGSTSERQPEIFVRE
ncbi:alanine racemase [Leptolyngbya ohadii]|uniref:alanine racemase n=1 Tax=Leptolyngbya ohadii TaxID=1962290 RepID=UPI000B59CAF7|nr:alanine racemase [Leptolyngbya ohadii]